MSIETRLFKHRGDTYLFTKETNTIPGDPKSYKATLREIKYDGSVSEPLITKGRSGSTITRFREGVSSEINPWKFKITDGDKLTLSGKHIVGNIREIYEFKIPTDGNGTISRDSLEKLSPIAKRWLRKVGEFLAKVGRF